MLAFPANIAKILSGFWAFMFGVGGGQSQYRIDAGIATHVGHTVTATVTETVYQARAAVPTGWLCRKLYGR